MKLPLQILSNRVQWLVSLRWIVCLGVILVVWVSSWVLKVVSHPMPLYIIVGAMLVYNSIFAWFGRRRTPRGSKLDRNIILQIALDQIALILLLYFSGVHYNPFIFYFVFHLIIASLLLPGRAPYYLAGLASVLVGLFLVAGYLGVMPENNTVLEQDTFMIAESQLKLDEIYMFGFFIAFSTTLWITVYFTSSINNYMHQMQAVMRQKEKMLGIGQLVAGIAHQISNPLDGVQNCLQTIGKSVNGDPHLHKYVTMMNEALERIERTAKRVQFFARPRGLELQDTDVNKAVEAVMDLLGQTSKHGVSVRTNLGNIPLVWGDTFTLQEVIFNLCTNALTVMPEGGELTLSTFVPERPALAQFKRVTVEVTDTGSGIRPEHLDKIFEPFFTTRQNEGGTGLGLALCRMLISEMGGDIEVESQLGEGTTFRIILNTAESAYIKEKELV
ncbi:MAG: hypothetical protein JW860_03905 [Sedimentisphaerales bacterium]|nr:hypothetical protein [Sedimentisphaerales bacterium]